MGVATLQRVYDRLRKSNLRWMVRYSVHRAYSSFWEHRLGIRTRGNEIWDGSQVSDLGNHAYSPTSYLDFRKSIRWIPRPLEDVVLLDYGSGMGRAVLMAATYPFRTVIGVEISPALTRIAEDNLGWARGKLKCRDVRLVTADAVAYPFPPEVTVVFFYNPFGEDILIQVLDNIERSLDEHPRTLTVIYANPRRFENVVCRHGWLRKEGEFSGLHPHVICRHETDRKNGRPAPVSLP